MPVGPFGAGAVAVTAVAASTTAGSRLLNRVAFRRQLDVRVQLGLTGSLPDEADARQTVPISAK